MQGGRLAGGCQIYLRCYVSLVVGRTLGFTVYGLRFEALEVTADTYKCCICLFKALGFYGFTCFAYKTLGFVWF